MSELNDHRDGRFTLYIRPQEVGRHHLTVQVQTIKLSEHSIEIN